MAANRKGRKQTADPAAWAAQIRAAIAPRPTIIPTGFLRLEDFEKAWDLSRVQVRRVLAQAVRDGRLEKLYIRALGSDGRLHLTPIFGLKQKRFDGSRLSK